MRNLIADLSELVYELDLGSNVSDWTTVGSSPTIGITRCSAVGSTLVLGTRGRGFESRHFDCTKSMNQEVNVHMLNLVEETEFRELMDKIKELESRVSALEDILSTTDATINAEDNCRYRGRLDDYIRDRLQSEVSDSAVLLEFDENPDKWIINHVVAALTEDERTFAKSLVDYYNLNRYHDKSRSLAIICKKNKKMMKIVIDHVSEIINEFKSASTKNDNQVVEIKLVDGWDVRYPKYLKKLRIISNNLKQPHLIDDVLHEIYSDLKSVYGWVYEVSNKNFVHNYQRYPSSTSELLSVDKEFGHVFLNLLESRVDAIVKDYASN